MIGIAEVSRAMPIQKLGGGGESAIVIVLVAVAYFAAARLGLALAVEAPQVSAVWPPTGIALAAVLRLGYRTLPAIFVGALFANAMTGAPLWVAAGIATGNTAEALIGAVLVSRLSPDGDSVRTAVGFFLAAAIAPIVSALVGVTCLVYGGVQPPAMYFDHLRVWWVGDALGALVVAPLLATWTKTAIVPTRKLLELALVLTFGVLFCAVVFYQPSGLPFSEYIVFPFVAWAAMRLSVPATAVVVAACDAVAVAATYAGYGPFAGFGPERGLLHLQAFIAVAASTGLLLAAVAEAQRGADRQKNEFIAILAHELRNPLGAITNAARLLDAESAKTDVARYATDVIGRQAAHLARLLDDLLDVGRLVTGKIILSKEPIDLAEAAERAVHSVRATGNGVDHEIALDCHPVYVEADRTRIEQIVVNLVANAIKHTPKAGSIAVSTRAESGQAVLVVTDTGIGLTVAESVRVFDLFYQGARDTTRQGGLGIGLTLVRRLVEMHDGRISAASRGRGLGATFTVMLPAIQPPAQVPSSPLQAVAQPPAK